MADTTFAIALSGLSLATLDLALRVYDWFWRDRAKLKLDVALGRKVGSNIQLHREIPKLYESQVLALQVTNDGRRVANVRGGGVGHTRENRLWVFDKTVPSGIAFPKRLGEADFVVIFEDLPVLAERLDDSERLVPDFAWVEINRGKRKKQKIPADLQNWLRSYRAQG